MITGYPLIVVTGLNSTGKSSLLQTILLLNKTMTKNGAICLSKLPSTFPIIRNRYENAKEIDIRLTVDEKVVNWRMTDEGKEEVKGEKIDLEIEKNLFYLAANRTGTEAISSVLSEAKSGIHGEYLMGTFEKEKSTPVISELVKETISSTLSTQLNYWLTYILDIKMEMSTELLMGQDVQTSYKSDGITNLSPSQLGSGVGYRIRYEVYKKRLAADSVSILYKEHIRSHFLKISIDSDGKLDQDFPTGFFDATLGELIEME